MLQAVAKDGQRLLLTGGKTVGVGAVVGRVDDMGKQLAANGVEQLVLRLEVGIKGAAAHIRPLDNILDSYPVIGLNLKQRFQRVKNCLSCFFLSSVHFVPFL